MQTLTGLFMSIMSATPHFKNFQYQLGFSLEVQTNYTRKSKNNAEESEHLENRDLATNNMDSFNLSSWFIATITYNASKT